MIAYHQVIIAADMLEQGGIIKMKNPFLELYSLMGEATKVEASFFVAKVVSPLPNLKIQLNDIILDKDDFLISKWLLDRNEDLFTEYQGHSHGGDTTLEIKKEASTLVASPIKLYNSKNGFFINNTSLL